MLHLVVESRYSEGGKYPVYGSNGEIARTEELLNPAPTIAIGRVGANCGSVFRIDGPSWVTDNAIVATPAHHTDFGFLFYKLESLDLGHIAIGSAQPLITQSGLKIINTTIPPLPEQKAIAHILGTLDDKIDLNRRMNATLEAIAQAIFKSWFIDFDPVRAKMSGRQPYGMDANTAALFPNRLVDSGTELGMIPEGWEVGTLGQICDVLGGYAFKSNDFSEDGVPVIKIKNIRDDYTVDVEDVVYISPDIANTAKDYLLTDGDLLMAMTGAKVAKFGLVVHVGPQSILNQRVARFTPKEGIRKIWFTYAALFINKVIEQVIGAAHGSAQPNVSAEGIKSAELAMPAIALINRYNTVVDGLFELIIHNRRQSQTLAALRDTLLPRLMSGDLRVGETEEMEEGARR